MFISNHIKIRPMKFKLMIALAATLSFTACKDDKDEDNTPACVAGRGGQVTVSFFPEHHGEPIPGIASYPDSAMIKYNTSEFPGDNPALYDFIAVGDLDSIKVVVDSLKCGNYFVFMTGWDVSIAERVKGGIPVTITETSGTKSVKIPITED